MSDYTLDGKPDLWAERTPSGVCPRCKTMHSLMNPYHCEADPSYESYVPTETAPLVRVRVEGRELWVNAETAQVWVEKLGAVILEDEPAPVPPPEPVEASPLRHALESLEATIRALLIEAQPDAALCSLALKEMAALRPLLLDVRADAKTREVLAVQKDNRSDEAALEACHRQDRAMSRKTDKRKPSVGPLRSEAEVFAGFTEE